MPDKPLDPSRRASKARGSAERLMAAGDHLFVVFSEWCAAGLGKATEAQSSALDEACEELNLAMREWRSKSRVETPSISSAQPCGQFERSPDGAWCRHCCWTKSAHDETSMRSRDGQKDDATGPQAIPGEPHA